MFMCHGTQYEDVIRVISLTGNRYPISKTLMSQFTSFPSDYCDVERMISLMVEAGMHLDHPATKT